jgi:assimilatory nitrate reductase catalytic subunit
VIHLTGTPVLSAEPPLSSHCCFCSMQCGMEIVAGDKQSGLAVKPSSVFPVATGRLCQKGLNALGHVVHPERIVVPLRRIRSLENSNGPVFAAERHPESWETAFHAIANDIKQIQEKYGNDSVSVYGGGSMTNEVCYLLGKFRGSPCAPNILIITAVTACPPRLPHPIWRSAWTGE